jgi:superfamily I DNA and/or RNA helicase
MNRRKPEKPTNPYQQSGNKNLVRILFLSVIGLLTLLVFQWKEHEKDHQLLESKERNFSEVIAELSEKEKSLVDQLKDALEEKTAAEHMRKELELQLRGSKGGDDGSGSKEKELEEMQASVDLVRKQIDNLHIEMQRIAKKEAIEK